MCYQSFAKIVLHYNSRISGTALPRATACHCQVVC
jgi:hypothetical protein